MTFKKPQMGSLLRLRREVREVLLDTTGIILLSGSANEWLGLAAGMALLGVGCFFLNWKWHEDKPSR